MNPCPSLPEVSFCTDSLERKNKEVDFTDTCLRLLNRAVGDGGENIRVYN